MHGMGGLLVLQHATAIIGLLLLALLAIEALHLMNSSYMIAECQVGPKLLMTSSVWAQLHSFLFAIMVQ